MRNLIIFFALCLAALFLASCQIHVVEPPFYARFQNMLYTDIRVKVDGYGSRVIAPGETVSFRINRSDQTYRYEAETNGVSATGAVIGLVVEWERTRDIVGDSYTTYLVTNPDLFFLKMLNTGYRDLYPLYVNYGTSAQTRDDIIIPGNGMVYDTGYYYAYTNTQVRAYWMNLPSDYTYWRQGYHFSFPWTQNQAVTLISNFKKDGAFQSDYKVESNLVEHNSTEPFGIDAGTPRGDSNPTP